MKKMISVVLMSAVMVASAGVFVQSVSAEEVRMVGTIMKIEMEAGGTTADAILKDNMTGEIVSVIVSDELTLEKLIGKHIVEGDEIGCKYNNVDGKNKSRMFRIIPARC